MARPIFFDLILKLFDISKGNMRSLRLYRVVKLLVVLPLFTILFITNNFFLFLDHLFFFRFKTIKIVSPVFIASLPRTGTTYLLHGLNDYDNHFTTIKLYEQLIAPSIIQKCIILICSRLDKSIGGILKKSWQSIETIILAPVRQFHLTGMAYPEEDDLMLLWSLETAYLSMLYPDSNVAKDFFRFDIKISPARKKRVMRRYMRLVQRHMFVFSDNGNKCFLTKNPLFIPKLLTLKEFFPDAIIISINRCPSSTIPSTIALNKRLSGFSSNVEMPSIIEKEVFDLLVDWYSYSHKHLVVDEIFKYIEVQFESLIENREVVLIQIFEFLRISPTSKSLLEKNKVVKHNTPIKYDNLSASELKILIKKAPFLESSIRCLNQS